MKQTIVYSATVLILSLGLFSCKDKIIVEPPPPQSPTIKIVTNASPNQADGWLYYSFDKDTTISASQEKSADWDIKFRYTPFDTTQSGIGRFVSIYTQTGPIYFNSGTINTSGQTQATIVRLPFDSVQSATPYIAQLKNDDTSTSARIVPTVKLGPDPNPYFIYNPATRGVTVSATSTFVIKTKSNKYVKMQLLSIYQNSPQNPSSSSVTNYYSFRYVKANPSSQSFVQ